MALESSNVGVAVTGAVSMGAVGAAAITGTGSALGVRSDLGYINEDGVTESRDRTSDKIKAWQNGATVRTIVTDSGLTYKFVMLETKAETVELYYGSDVTPGATEGSFVIIPAATGGRRDFVIDVVDGDELERVWIPEGEVTEVGDKVYANGEPIGYEVTIEAYENAGISGNAKVWSTRLATDESSSSSSSSS